MLRPSHPHWRDHSNYTSRTVQVMKLLIVQFSLASRYLIPLQSKYYPQHPVLIHPQSGPGHVDCWQTSPMRQVGSFREIVRKILYFSIMQNSGHRRMYIFRHF
jgi:hypothetical protein